jgi:hypothetical protein
MKLQQSVRLVLLHRIVVVRPCRGQLRLWRRRLHYRDGYCGRDRRSISVHVSVVYGGELRMQIGGRSLGHRIPPMRFDGRIAHNAQHVVERQVVL